ncbi:MAG: zinc-finger domain-containing protein [Rhizomicrobium sp.]
MSQPSPISPPEIIEVDDTRVACDGGGGVLGHPKVYLEMGDRDFVECPYCDRRFVLRPGAKLHGTSGH